MLASRKARLARLEHWRDQSSPEVAWQSSTGISRLLEAARVLLPGDEADEDDDDTPTGLAQVLREARQAVLRQAQR